jgi:hypothetical protein
MAAGRSNDVKGSGIRKKLLDNPDSILDAGCME